MVEVEVEAIRNAERNVVLGTDTQGVFGSLKSNNCPALVSKVHTGLLMAESEADDVHRGKGAGAPLQTRSSQLETRSKGEKL